MCQKRTSGHCYDMNALGHERTLRRDVATTALWLSASAAITGRDG